MRNFQSELREDCVPCVKVQSVIAGVGQVSPDELKEKKNLVWKITLIDKKGSLYS